jgi:apolipoprotein N-acyltransferase
VAHTGLIGFHQQLAASPAAWQTLVDIAIALGLVLVWMHQDVRRGGRAFWPWVPVTLLLGSFRPLLYLLRRPAAPSG